MHTNHIAIMYMMNKLITPDRITRWLLLIQEFDITIVEKPWKDNVVANFLSRLDTSDEGTPIENSFPDEHIFVISTHTLWYEDIANYLSTGKVPQHLTYREQRNIIHHSARYLRIEEYLFYIGLDQQMGRCIGEDDIYDVLKVAHDVPLLA